jgi:CheY-like chemotaxis protein
LDERSRESLTKCVRDALNHLQDPSYLRRSPLALLFGLANRSDTPAALQRILVGAIEALEPRSDESPDSRAWRMYESVFYRYVEGFRQEDVADQLGMSVRQLRREQRAAFEALAYRLCDQFDLDLGGKGPEEAASGGLSPTNSAALNDELAWLEDVLPESPTDLGQVMCAAVDLVRSIAAQHQVRLQMDLDSSLPLVAMDPVAARQTLLNLFSVAIGRACPGSQVLVSATVLQWDVQVDVRCSESRPGQEGSADEVVSLGIARRLVQMCGGRTQVSTDGTSFAATLALPALEQLPILAVDDNADTLQLLRRYTTGTRYRLIETRDPEQALLLAERHSPKVIVLDVMMPRVDGWEVLGRLREHPLTRQIPIVVCTILAQEELALSLGASGFVRKPITRQALLAALDRQLGPKVKAPG